MISISIKSLQVIIFICACLSWQQFACAENDADRSGSTTTKSDNSAKVETVSSFFDKVKRLQSLRNFTKENIEQATGMPLSIASVATWISPAEGDEILLHVAHSREDKVTIVELIAPKSLTILKSDINAHFGAGKVSKVRSCDEIQKTRHGYEQMQSISYKKSGLNTQFEMITAPKARLYEVGLFRD